MKRVLALVGAALIVAVAAPGAVGAAAAAPAVSGGQESPQLICSSYPFLPLICKGRNE